MIRQRTLQGALITVFMLAISCAPKDPSIPETKGTGTLVVDAQISNGSRFVGYTNDVWAQPQRLAVAAGRREQYQFSLPDKLHSLRFDPSEAPQSHAEIYSVSIVLPGMPKKLLPLSDLPKFLRYHCRVAMDGKAVKVDAEGPDMYFMSTVDPASYPLAN